MIGTLNNWIIERLSCKTIFKYWCYILLKGRQFNYVQLYQYYPHTQNCQLQNWKKKKSKETTKDGIQWVCIKFVDAGDFWIKLSKASFVSMKYYFISTHFEV